MNAMNRATRAARCNAFARANSFVRSRETISLTGSRGGIDLPLADQGSTSTRISRRTHPATLFRDRRPRFVRRDTVFPDSPGAGVMAAVYAKPLRCWSAPVAAEAINERLLSSAGARRFVEKGWGWEEWITNDPVANYCLKRLFIRGGCRGSLHCHRKRPTEPS
jgi:hypothetical protein